MTNERKILTLREVSERTRIPVNTHRWMRYRGEGPPTWKLGGRVVAYEDEVIAWLQQQYEQSTSDRKQPW